MKINIIKSIFLAAILFLAACESDQILPDLQKLPFPLFTLDVNNPTPKLIQNDNFSTKFTVDMYFKQDYPADAKLVVIRNGDKTNPKVLAEGVTTFPYEFTVTAAKLKTAFNITTSIPLGDTFEIGLDAKLNDRWYPAFNPDGESYGASLLAGMPGVLPTVKFTSVCALDLNDYVGPVTVTDPFLFKAPYETTAEKVDATHLKIKDFAGVVDITLNIDLADRSVTIDNTLILEEISGLHNLMMVTAAPGEINACTKVVKTSIQWSVDEGSWKPKNLTFTFHQ